jgi:hydroxymethylpyrimidine/phosphomethylpyrimidine kinase
MEEGMEILGIAIGIFAAILTYLTWHNGKWMKAVLKTQTEMLSKQTEMIGRQNEVLSKQTEMLGEIKNLIVTEAQLTRQTIIETRQAITEVLERMDRTTKEILGKILERIP